MLLPEKSTLTILHSLKSEVKKELAKTEQRVANLSEFDQLNRKSLWLKQIAVSLRALPPEVAGQKMDSIAVCNTAAHIDEVVQLNRKLTIKENADLFEKKSVKADSQRGAAGNELTLLKTRLSELQKATAAIDALRFEAIDSADFTRKVEEIRTTLFGDGSTTSAATGQTKVRPLPFRTYLWRGYTIYAGKTDEQNDELSTKYTAPTDIWFHAAHCPGSHVVLKNSTQPPPESDAIERTASLAAWFSKSRNAPSAEVHYTEGRFVHKRKGAPKGEVQLEKFHTLKVPPQSPEILFG